MRSKRKERKEWRKESGCFLGLAPYYLLLTTDYLLLYGRNGWENGAGGLLLRKTINSTRRLDAWPSRVAFDSIGWVPAYPVEEKRSARNWWYSVKYRINVLARAVERSQFEGYAADLMGWLSVCPSTVMRFGNSRTNPAIKSRNSSIKFHTIWVYPEIPGFFRRPVPEE